ncbi:hypothetical protein [Microbacterium aurugineum]
MRTITPASKLGVADMWRSLVSLVTGIVSVAGGFIFFLPIVGLVFGIVGLKRESVRRVAITGIILNAVMLVIWAVIVILVAVAWASWAASGA